MNIANNKVKLIGVLILFMPLYSFTQLNKGIIFESELSWKEILAKAKAEDKYVFIDCYTTWCAPCKYMSQKIFTQRSVGEFMNVHFINVSVQMDQTSLDSENVKKWYSDAQAIKEAYSITAFPTYLFFSPDGQLVHRFVGRYIDSEFIKKANEAFIPEKQYYLNINNYQKHLGDSVFLRRMLVLAEEQYDFSNSSIIGKYYLNCLKNPLAPDNLKLLIQATQSSSNETFQFLLENVSKIDNDSPLKNVIKDNLIRIVADEEINPLFEKKDTILNWRLISDKLKKRYPSLENSVLNFSEGRFQAEISAYVKEKVLIEGNSIPNWGKVAKELKKKFIAYDCSRILADIKPQYYAFKNKWTECAEASIKLFDKYGDQLSAGHINNIVFAYLFMHSSNINVLSNALKWSKHCIDVQPDSYNQIDTYANLLYKTGNIKEAINWEEKAIERCILINDTTNLKVFQETIKKMQTGEKTWKD